MALYILYIQKSVGKLELNEQEDDGTAKDHLPLTYRVTMIRA